VCGAFMHAPPKMHKGGTFEKEAVGP
jgi:hypothetical protein